MPDRAGQQFGNYRLVRLLGYGGFAEVYLAEHVRLQTQAAIKVLHTSLHENDASMFLQEAQTVARLKHPHIVRVLDFDLEGPTPFLVMDYLPNGSLRQHHPTGTPLSLDLAVSYVAQVASALQYAHDEHVMHRDIKPENMLFDQHYNVVLSDFGIALMSQSSRAQSTQEVAGTAAYMAPEQLRGKPRRASDQYALGIVVYEWLSGDRPFNGTFSEVASQHLFVAPPALHDKVAALPPSIEQAVMKALAKDPDERFPSVQAFATALTQASQDIKPVTLNNLHSQPPAPRGSGVTSSPPTRIDTLATNLSTPPAAPSFSERAPTQTGASGAFQTVAVPDPSTTGPKSIAFPSSPVTSAQQKHQPSLTPASLPAANLPASANYNPQAAAPRPHIWRNLAFLVTTLIVVATSITGTFYFMNSNSDNSGGKVHLVPSPTPYTQKSYSTPTIQAYSTPTMQAQQTDATVTVQPATSRIPYPPYSGKLVLDDPLSNNGKGNGWQESSQTIGSGYASAGQTEACQFVNGAYDYTIPAHYGGPCVASATNFSNFAYEVSMKFVKTAPNWSGGGLVFRANGSNYYEFEVFESGRYSLDICGGSSCAKDLTNGEGITPQGTISSFHTGLNQANVIAIVANGSTFDLYVNQQHIFGPVSDSTYTHGQIGVYAEGGFDVNNATAQTSETEVVYSNAKVWQL